MIDIGLNFTSKRYESERPQLLTNAISAGLTHIIITGSDVYSNERAIELCANYSSSELKLYSTVGIHPHHADQVSIELCKKMSNLVIQPCVVSMGEMGLDFFRNLCSQTIQENAFEMQLELAASNGKPVFLHQRDAHHRLFPILKNWRDKLGHVVIHCFTDNCKALYDYLDLDCYIGITGWICDERRGKDLQNIVTNIPLQRLMIETDGPYLIPQTIIPQPTSNRNEPAYLVFVAEKIAECYQIPVSEIIKSTAQNAQFFFSLKEAEKIKIPHMVIDSF